MRKHLWTVVPGLALILTSLVLRPVLPQSWWVGTARTHTGRWSGINNRITNLEAVGALILLLGMAYHNRRVARWDEE